MKRLLAMLLAFAILMSIAACSGDPAPAAAEPTQETTIPTQGQTDPTQTATSVPTQPVTGETAPTETTAAPTDPTQSAPVPTQAPTQATAPTTPVQAPTAMPTTAPVQRPTSAPTQAPTYVPTQRPTNAPAQRPTAAPTQRPTAAPTQAPTAAGHSHSYTAKVTPATCTEGGYTTNTCACGHSYVSGQTAAKGHGATKTEMKEATTSAAGYTRTICTVCNTVLSTVEIPQLEHTCTMERISCKDLKDGAVGWYTTQYRTYTEFTILACSECGLADVNSLEFIYSTEQITETIITMINQERYDVYGTHEYDVVISSNLTYAEGRAKFATEAYIRNGYLSHEGADYSENLTATSMAGNMVRLMFNRWKDSQGHYALMIDKDAKYVALATCFDPSVGFIGCLVMTDTDCQHLGIPGHNN